MTKQRRIEMSDKTKQEYQKKLGEEFGPVFHGLWKDWALALMRMQEYIELFSNTEHVKLLNAITGGAFLWDIQHIFWDDLMLRVTRLTDPICTSGKSNLTVQRLPEFCKDKEAELHKEVSGRVDRGPLPIPRTDIMCLLILGMTFYVAERGASEQARPCFPFSGRCLVHDRQDAGGHRDVDSPGLAR